MGWGSWMGWFGRAHGAGATEARRSAGAVARCAAGVLAGHYNSGLWVGTAAPRTATPACPAAATSKWQDYGGAWVQGGITSE